MTVNDNCANCGGQLPPFVQGQTFVQCHFCGHRANIEPPKPQIVIVRQPHHVPIVVTPVKTSPLVFLFVLIPIVVIGIQVAVSAGKSGGLNSGAIGLAPNEDLQWGNETPFIAKINADAIEDFVGRFHVLNSGGGKTTEEFVGGFDGATLKKLWTAGPYGDQGDTRGLHMVAVPGSVLVTDQKSIGHILDVTTGKEIGTITMSDRADSICVEPTGKPEAWIHVSDNEDLDVDFTTKRSKKAPRPPWCRSSASIGIDDIQCESGLDTKTTAHCSGVERSFKAPNFQAKKMLSDGVVSVIVGTKSPGTAIPTAIGYDPKAQRILWQRPIPQSDATHVADGLGLVDLAGGKLVAQIQLSTGIYKLAALDGHTGAELWETEIPRSKDGSEADQMLITTSRVYLPHWTWLDVFDAKTGAVIGSVGVW